MKVIEPIQFIFRTCIALHIGDSLLLGFRMNKMKSDPFQWWWSNVFLFCFKFLCNECFIFHTRIAGLARLRDEQKQPVSSGMELKINKLVFVT